MGSGSGRAAGWLADHGYEVDAVDSDHESVLLAREILAGRPGVKVYEQPFSSFEFGSYDLILALFSIFFVPPAEFAELWPRALGSLKPDGLFAGQFIGPGDDWASDETTSLQRAELEGLFSSFKFELFEEVSRLGKTVWGEQKQWHIFHVIARKR